MSLAKLKAAIQAQSPTVGGGGGGGGVRSQAAPNKAYKKSRIDVSPFIFSSTH